MIKRELQIDDRKSYFEYSYADSFGREIVSGYAIVKDITVGIDEQMDKFIYKKRWFCYAFDYRRKNGEISIGRFTGYASREDALIFLNWYAERKANGKTTERWELR